jgi:hypothetical protein
VTSGYRPALAAAAGFSVIGALAALGVRQARGPALTQATPAPPRDASERSEPVAALPASRAK